MSELTDGGGDTIAGSQTAPDIEAVRGAFPQLEIIESIGHGGMGTVFQARQRESAAKRSFSQYSGDTVPDSLVQPDDHAAMFDHDWAQTTIDRAIALLGDVPETQTFLPYLTQELTAEDRNRLASALGKTAVAVKVTLHRLRKKFRQHVRDQIARTVETESEVDGEPRTLRAGRGQLFSRLPLSNVRSSLHNSRHEMKNALISPPLAIQPVYAILS